MYTLLVLVTEEVVRRGVLYVRRQVVPDEVTLGQGVVPEYVLVTAQLLRVYWIDKRSIQVQ